MPIITDGRKNADNCGQFKNKADYAEVKHGEWIYCESLLGTERLKEYGIENIKCKWFKCSLCGRKEFELEPYCNCGAQMDGRSDGDGDD
jgi:hypothetical protein